MNPLVCLTVSQVVV